MEMTGEQPIAAAREQTWAALHDPDTLKACVPGCETIEKISGTEFNIVMAAAVGPVKARFKGKLTLANVEAPQSYDIVFEGQGGVAGFAKGSAHVQLLDGASANETVLAYAVHASVGGKLAQIGSRLVDGAAKKTAEAFFERFRAQMSGAG
jgi:uncharacterized protein